MINQRYEWFVEPQNSHTNNIFSQNIDEEDYLEGLICADKQKHNLWRCRISLIRYLWHSRDDLEIRFRIFNRELPYGKIRDCTFLFKKRKTKKVAPTKS